MYHGVSDYCHSCRQLPTAVLRDLWAGHTHFGDYNSIVVDARELISDVEANMDDDGQLDEDTWPTSLPLRMTPGRTSAATLAATFWPSLIIRVLGDMAEAGYDPVIQITRLSDFTVKITLCKNDPTSDGYYEWLDIMRLSLVDFLSEYFDDEDDEIVIRGVCFMLDDVDDDEACFIDPDELSDDEEDDPDNPDDSDEPAAA